MLPSTKIAPKIEKRRDATQRAMDELFGIRESNQPLAMRMMKVARDQAAQRAAAEVGQENQDRARASGLQEDAMVVDIHKQLLDAQIERCNTLNFQ